MAGSGKLISTAEQLMDLLEELESLCAALKERGIEAIIGESTSSAEIRLLGEYRQFMKLKYEFLKNSGHMIDEARFQKAVLHALKRADEELYEMAIKNLRELEDEWNGEEEIPLEDDEYSEADDV